jgi:opacity protein-like surface antigen
MNKTLSTILIAACALFTSHAFAANAECEKNAIDKNGKALAGAAKTSYMKKCEKGHGGGASCEAKAVDKNGKTLAGAAKTSFLKKCEADHAAPAAAAASK